MSIDLKTEGADYAAHVAYYNAANTVVIARAKGDNLHWPTFGVVKDVENALQSYLAPLASFVRASGAASGEALYRFAQGIGIHDALPHAFDALDVEYRLAYSAFAATLTTIDRLIADEVQRTEAALQASRPAPIAAALKLPPSETTLERVDDPLAKVSFAPEASTVGVTVQPAAATATAETAVAAALGGPVDPAPAAGPTYWINPITEEVQTVTGDASPAGDGWTAVSKPVHDGFAHLLSERRPAVPSADGAASDAASDQAGDQTASDQTGSDPAGSDGEGSADGAAADAGTVKPGTAKRRPAAQ